VNRNNNLSKASKLSVIKAAERLMKLRGGYKSLNSEYLCQILPTWLMP
jgi:hypothetical protein